MVLDVPVWSLMVLYDFVWSQMVLYGPIRSSMVPYGPAWSHIVAYGHVCSCMTMHGPIYWSLHVPQSNFECHPKSDVVSDFKIAKLYDLSIFKHKKC